MIFRCTISFYFTSRHFSAVNRALNFKPLRVTRIIRTSFLATNIRHQFVKRLECINILSSAFSCCWRIFVSQKISDPRALIFRWFWVRRTTQCINLARTTSPKAPKIKALGLVRIILVTLILFPPRNIIGIIMISAKIKPSRLREGWVGSQRRAEYFSKNQTKCEI